MKKIDPKGFSMIELLVVLLIIAVLAAVAAPLFLSNTTKAKLSEAVASAGSIRSGMRTYYSQYGAPWLTVTSSETLYFGTNGASSSLLGVTIHGNKYFSPAAYVVIPTSAGGAWTTKPAGVNDPLDFVITVTGNNSQSLSTDSVDGAASNGDVANFMLEMDNAGQIIYSTNGTSGPWSKY